MISRFCFPGENHLLHRVGEQSCLLVIGFCFDCRVVGGAEALLASPDLDVNAHITDNDAGGASYHYRVAASNGSGPRRLVSTVGSF